METSPVATGLAKAELLPSLARMELLPSPEMLRDSCFIRDVAA